MSGGWAAGCRPRRCRGRRGAPRSWRSSAGSRAPQRRPPPAAPRGTRCRGPRSAASGAARDDLAEPDVGGREDPPADASGRRIHPRLSSRRCVVVGDPQARGVTRGRRPIRSIVTAFPGRDLTRSDPWTSLAQIWKKGSQIVRLGRVDVGQRSETVHRANLSAIVRGLHERGPQSRSELVAATGLTRSAIRTLIGELAAAGLVTEERPVRLGTPGRPSPLVRLDPERGRRARPRDPRRFDRRGDRRARRRDLRTGSGSTDRAGTSPSMTSSPISPDWPASCVPGTTRRSSASASRSRGSSDVATGSCAMAPNLGWVDVPLGARLARGLAVAVPIVVSNDADCGDRRRAPSGCRGRRRRRHLRVRRGRRRRGRHRRRPAAHRERRVRRRDRPHDRQPGRGQPAAAAASAAGRPRSARACCWRAPAMPPMRVARASTACCAMPRTGRRRRWPPSTTSGAGSASASAALVNVFNPRLIVLGGLHAPDPSARPQRRRGASWPSHSLPASRAQVRIVPATLGRRCPAHRCRGAGIRTAPRGPGRLVRRARARLSIGERVMHGGGSPTAVAVHASRHPDRTDERGCLTM